MCRRRPRAHDLSPLCGYGNTEPRLEDTGRRSDGRKLSLAYYTKGAQPKTLSSKLGKSIAQWGAGDLNQPPVRAAFEKMLATGTAAHHTEHVLGALLFETEWETARAVEAGKDTERLRGVYIRKLQKLIRDSAFRKKLTRQFTADHSAFE